MKMRILNVLLFSLAGVSGVQAEPFDLPEVVINAPLMRELPPATLSATVAELDPGVPADGGILLRSIPGADGSRMGGLGIDPIIRGQSQNQLNVLVDGAYAFGGCPNRMDPPTVYADLDGTDEVTVIKGSQTLIYGGGGSGGTILFERNTPRFADGERPRVVLKGGVTGNSNTVDGSIDMAAGNATGFGRANLHKRTAENYKDGNGDEVRSAYNTEGVGATLGYTPSDDTRMELSFNRTHDYDVLFAGAGMDSPYSDSDQWRLRLHHDTAIGPFSALNAEVYRVEVDHLMDNYSLRTQTAPRKMRVPSSSDTSGGRVVADLDAGAMDWNMGVDYIQVDRDATRFWDLKSDAVDVPNSYMWPDVSRSSLGLFAEMQYPVSERGQITAGLRYDRVQATISESRANTRPVGPAWVMSPNQLYTTYYGQQGEDRDENNIGGLLRYAHELGDGLVATGGISRSVRTADATERYLSSNNMVGAMRWIGNPGLDPEKHHQIDITLGKESARWNASLDLFYDHVTDYILRDRAHGQAGILKDDGATIYRNVDATLYGGELYGAYRITERLRAGASIAYVYAQNRTDDRAIAQIPPLNGTVNLDYAEDRWSVGGRVKWSDTQTRVDDDLTTGSGQDVGETAGWWVLDLYGKIKVGQHGDVLLGVDNVFDRAYAYHVNRANVDPFNPQAIQVNEPGRTFWARAALTF